MALFSNESEKNVRLEQSDQPQSTPALGVSMTRPASDGGVERPAPTASSACLDRGTKVSGKLRFEGPARIDGHVDGEIDGKDITIGESAVVTAQIRAESVIVWGQVKGEITATRRIEICPSAKVTGNITAPKFVVQEGANFDGQCAMGPEVSHEDRNRAPNWSGAQA
jgi:cytoskeletal protein CcmA (bactofilin family)